MNTFRLEDLFLALGLILAIIVFVVLLPGCNDGHPSNTRIIDAEGKVIYEPPNPPSQTLQIPSTGNQTVDYVFASIAAAVYAVMGYAIRKTSINGKAETVKISNRLARLELLNPAILRHPSLVELNKEFDLQRPLTDVQLKQIITRLASQPTTRDQQTP